MPSTMNWTTTGFAGLGAAPRAGVWADTKDVAKMSTVNVIDRMSFTRALCSTMRTVVKPQNDRRRAIIVEHKERSHVQVAAASIGFSGPRGSRDFERLDRCGADGSSRCAQGYDSG